MSTQLIAFHFIIKIFLKIIAKPMPLGHSLTFPFKQKGLQYRITPLSCTRLSKSGSYVGSWEIGGIMDHRIGLWIIRSYIIWDKNKKYTLVC